MHALLILSYFFFFFFLLLFSFTFFLLIIILDRFNLNQEVKILTDANFEIRLFCFFSFSFLLFFNIKSYVRFKKIFEDCVIMSRRKLALKKYASQKIEHFWNFSFLTVPFAGKLFSISKYIFIGRWFFFHCQKNINYH